MVKTVDSTGKIHRIRLLKYCSCTIHLFEYIQWVFAYMRQETLIKFEDRSVSFFICLLYRQIRCLLYWATMVWVLSNIWSPLFVSCVYIWFHLWLGVVCLFQYSRTKRRVYLWSILKFWFIFCLKKLKLFLFDLLCISIQFLKYQVSSWLHLQEIKYVVSNIFLPPRIILKKI